MSRAHWLLLGAAALLGTGGAGPAAGQAPAEERTVVVRVLDDRFDPAVIEVRPGDVVKFVQGGQRRHNVEFRLKGAPEGFQFGPGRRGPYLVEAGDVYEIRVDERFEEPGSYPFLCTPHSIVMRGELQVRAEPERVALP